jgi:putative nucleotidyltransferase with HDIG domain
VALTLVRPEIFSETRSLLALAVLYLFEIILAYLIFYRWETSGYLLPVTVAAMLATILLSPGVGWSFGVFLALVLGVVQGFDFAPVLVVVLTCSVSCLAVRNVRKRHQFYRPIVVLTLTYAVLIVLIEALRFTDVEQVLIRAGYGVLNGALSPGIAIFSLSFFESTFRLTTDITLLELADMNHPLLRRLSVAAPGTYHHSIIVANLCEAAAEAVGANPLLARVGAYFHDIGKMEKPEYFVENQMGRKNKHEDLSPSMSALILSAHIKAGADMAREARLPEIIVDFIEQHHGTTQMSYFYRKAVEQAGHDMPDTDFRYPGPKPRLKETAILMLADSTEAVSRTLDDPRPNRLRSAIHQVITDKFMAGQLADCPLTLADLSRIEDAFLHLLLGAFHGRIRYPEQLDAEARKRESILG